VKRRKKEFSVDRHQRQTQNRLIIGGFLILMGVGGGLLWALYGGAAAVTAVACLLAAAGLFGGLWLILTLLELWVKEDEP
jgi:ABC-type uncharacterized transport system permease subunit